MTIYNYIAKRTVRTVLTVFAALAIVFFAMHSIPGDPVTLWISGADTSAKEIESLRHLYGFDKPVYLQFLDWLIRLLKGDLGNSLFTRTPVTTDLLSRLPVTLELVGFSLAVSLTIAVPLGVVAARKFNTRTDYAASAFIFFGMSIPEFYLGVLLVLVFALYIRLFPSSGLVPFYLDPVGHFRSITLAILTLGIARAAAIGRLMRSSMLEVLGQDYVRTAVSKGASDRAVVWKHAFRNAMIPVVTLSALQVGFLLGGTILVETVFGIPGLGSFGVNAILSRDYPRVQGFVLVIAIVFVITNYIVDLIYPLLDPRIRTR